MSIFNRLSRSAGGGETRSLSRSSFGFGSFSAVGQGRSSAGIEVTQDSAMQLSAVFGSVRVYASVVGSFPLGAFSGSDGTKKSLKNRPKWCDKPNSEDTRFTFASKVISSLLLDGNAFLLVVRDPSDPTQVLELIPVDPRAVYVDRDPERNWELRYRIGLPGVDPVALYAPDIVHIRHIILAGYLRGLSPIAYARHLVGGGIAMDDFAGRWFANGARPSGVITSTKDLTPDAAQIIRQSFSEAHSGVERSHLPAVLTAGLQWTALSITPEDAQFLETRQYTAEVIAGQLFGIPPSLIGAIDKHASAGGGNGMESLYDQWLKIGLGPLLETIEQSLSELLIVPPSAFVKYSVASLMRTDPQTRATIARARLDAGTASINEIRAEDDLPPLESEAGDVYWRPNTWVPLDAPAAVPAPKPGALLTDVHGVALPMPAVDDIADADPQSEPVVDPEPDDPQSAGDAETPTDEGAQQ